MFLKNVGSKFSLELCEEYHNCFGFACIWSDGKDLTFTNDWEESRPKKMPLSKRQINTQLNINTKNSNLKGVKL